jgi:hypothetical protein
LSALSAGDKLTHTESGEEAEYVTAIPTAGHGFLHLLKSATGYIFRLTGDLENEFAKAGQNTTLAEAGAGVSNVEHDLFARLEAMLTRAGLTQQQAQDVAQGGQTGPVPDVAAHLPAGVAAPAQADPTPPAEDTAPAEETAPVEAPAAPAETTPPPNSIPF